jgi:cytochrome c oxidase accessory protein FixG
MSEADIKDRPTSVKPDLSRLSQAPERSATIGESGKRKWVYSDIVFGRFLKARDILGVVLIVFYLLAPFLSVGGHPFLRLDVPARHFSIFGATFVMSDLFLLALLVLILTLALFLFSALLGRLWCGWACPQTVYLEGVFRRVERWIEGSHLQRRKLDSGPHDDRYWVKKISKHSLYLLISNLLGLSFAAYFVGPEGVYNMVFRPDTHPAAAAVVWVLTGTTYFNFVWFREQFCAFLCPYARLQSVMLDEHSLIIGYDPLRGEPRMPLRPGITGGDCVDCKRCVQVCPAGIDIRDGLQLECVNCVACIDACDSVMDKISRPRGLIRYDSLAGLERKSRKTLRPRVVLYVVVLAVLLTMFTLRLAGREIVNLTIVRPPGTPYLVQEDEMVRNRYTLNITNTDAVSRKVTVELNGKTDMQLLVPGQPFELKSGERISAEAYVLWKEDRISESSTPLEIKLMGNGQVLSTATAMFLGPIHDSEEHHEQ